MSSVENNFYINIYNDSDDLVKVFSTDNIINNAVNFLIENKFFIVSVASDLKNDFLIAYENALGTNNIYKKVVEFIADKEINIYNDDFFTNNKGSIIIDDKKVKKTDFILIIKEDKTYKLFLKNFGILDVDLNETCFLDIKLENSWSGEGIIIKNILNTNKEIISIFSEDSFGVYRIETNCKPINDESFQFFEEVIDLSSYKFLKLLIDNFEVSLNDDNDNLNIHFYDFFDDKYYSNAKYVYENLESLEILSPAGNDDESVDDEYDDDEYDDDEYEDDEYDDDESYSNLDYASLEGNINYEDIKHYKNILYFPLLEKEFVGNNLSREDTDE